LKLEEYVAKVEKFLPLTYIEAKQRKPFVKKLSDDWNFVTYPQSALNFALLIDRKNYIKNIFNEILKNDGTDEASQARRSTQILLATKQLIMMLVEISKQEYPDKETEYTQFLVTHFLENTEDLFETFQTVLDLNSRIEKKNEVPHELRGTTKPGPVDSWSGLFNGRRDIESTTFIELVIEWEEQSRAQIREYRNGKRKNKGPGKFKNIA
jgi:hypothetical protein